MGGVLRMAQLFAQSPGLTAYFLLLSALLGAVMGSFAGCMAARIGAGEDFVHGRSRCAACGHPLSAMDLVPVFSWLLLRGKCRYCGERIPASCPVAELLCAAAFAALAWRYGLSLAALEYWVLTVLLLAIALVDWETGWIPDRLLLAAGADFVLFAGLGGRFETALVRGFWGGVALAGPVLALVLVMDRVLRRESMGGGDIKLFFVAGLFFSWREALYLLLLSSVLGIAMALLLQKTTGDPDNPGAVPFGPAIAAGTVAALLTAEPVLTWYLSLF